MELLKLIMPFFRSIYKFVQEKEAELLTIFNVFPRWKLVVYFHAVFWWENIIFSSSIMLWVFLFILRFFLSREYIAIKSTLLGKRYTLERPFKKIKSSLWSTIEIMSLYSCRRRNKKSIFFAIFIFQITILKQTGSLCAEPDHSFHIK